MTARYYAEIGEPRPSKTGTETGKRTPPRTLYDIEQGFEKEPMSSDHSTAETKTGEDDN
jgi:hypothetical protein